MNANKDVRKSLDKMRRFLSGDKRITEQKSKSNKPLDMREMLKRARMMNEQSDMSFNIEDMTSTDKEAQKEKIQNAFKDQDVYVQIEEFKQYNDENGDPLAFFLSGGIDGVITFTLKVGKTEEISGVDWTATPEFSDDQRNEDIIQRLTDYYKDFYEEWRESLY